MKKQIVILAPFKISLAEPVRLAYTTNLSNEIKLLNVYYIPKLDEFGYNYSIPKSYLKMFKGKNLTKELEEILRLYDIIPYKSIQKKVLEYSNISKSKEYLKLAIMSKKI